MDISYPRLTRDFFMRDTVTVARELLGKTLVCGQHSGRITETEAYVGMDDPACHAARGKTKRNAVMFDEAGLSYVYFIYGMYYCLNIVTEDKDFAAAVLIRGVLDDTGPHWNGPGKLCRAWGITLVDNSRDMITDPDFAVYDSPSFIDFKATPRIGISKGLDKDWRFLAQLPKKA
jgi:DNA-3-methyladenine glycosylase